MSFTASSCRSPRGIKAEDRRASKGRPTARRFGKRERVEWTFYGFGAEDVAKVDPRYVFWNTHENVHDEATGENTSVLLDEAIPEGVQYDRMVPALIDIIKRLEKRVTELEQN